MLTDIREVLKHADSADYGRLTLEAIAELQDRLGRLSAFFSHAELRDRDKLQAVLLRIDQLEHGATTKRAERWHEVFVTVLRNVPITGEGWATAGVEWAKAAADAAYPPPPAAEVKP